LHLLIPSVGSNTPHIAFHRNAVHRIASSRYGQTGSGKTFTLTGGPERYADRGIIPRAITSIFTELSKRTQSTCTVHVS